MKKIYLIPAKRLFAFVLSFFFVFEISGIHAASKVWSYTGATGAWATGSNWVGGVAPVDGDDVTIGNTATTTFNNVPSLSLNSLTIGSTSSVTISSTGSTLTIASLNVTGKDLTIGSLVNMVVTNGSIASGKKLTINSSRTLTIAGTLTVAGSITNSGTITVNGVLNFTGSSPVAPSNVVVSAGGEVRFSGSGSVTGLGSSSVNGLCTFAGSTGTGSGFIASWGYGSTLQYAGTSAQTANYYELPSSNGPTNVNVNNSSGVNFSSSIGPSPVITGSLILTTGTLTMSNGSTYPQITFQNGDNPIIKYAGYINPGSSDHATIIFGTTGNTGGAAFTLPDNLFITNLSIYRLKVERSNPLTLNSQNITVSTFCSLNAGQVILGTGNLTVNASSVTTTGTFSTSTMFVTSSISGLLCHKFDTTTAAKSFTYPIGEISGTADYNGFAFAMNSNETASKTIGFKVVDDICNANIGSATNYTTRYYGTSIIGSGNYNYSVSLPYLSAASSDCSGGGGDVVGMESNMNAAYYSGSWIANGYAVSPNLVITNANETVAPLGYDIMGIDGAGTVSVNDPVNVGREMQIYPNPAKDQLTVYGLQFAGESNFGIYNMLGEKILSVSRFLDGNPVEVIDISILEKGMYFLQLNIGSSCATKKFLKQ